MFGLCRCSWLFKMSWRPFWACTHWFEIRGVFSFVVRFFDFIRFASWNRVVRFWKFSEGMDYEILGVV